MRNILELVGSCKESAWFHILQWRSSRGNTTGTNNKLNCKIMFIIIHAVENAHNFPCNRICSVLKKALNKIIICALFNVCVHMCKNGMLWKIQFVLFIAYRIYNKSNMIYTLHNSILQLKPDCIGYLVIYKHFYETIFYYSYVKNCKKKFIILLLKIFRKLLSQNPAEHCKNEKIT